MLTPLIRRSRKRVTPVFGGQNSREKERGFTMALVAVSMVAIIAMAALSIDIGTLYEAKAEAQRSADAAALAAARTISISGITGDPGDLSASWEPTCGGANSLATLAAIQVAQKNLIAGIAVPSANIKVMYGAGTAPPASPTCVGVANFGVNPTVSVYVPRTNLPIFFARVFSILPGVTLSSPSVSATATAEAYNPSGSGTAGPGMIPVNARCVKPLIVPNLDPVAGGAFVNSDGSIVRGGVNTTGAIGESFLLAADCNSGWTNCLVPGSGMKTNPPQSSGGVIHYFPGLTQGNAGAVPGACAASPGFQTAIVGCDQTAYACGTVAGATADLTENPVNPTGITGDAATALECLTNYTTGADNLNTGTFPFQIQAGFGNPLLKVGVNDNDVITTSNSIVTLPIYDGTPLLIGNPPTQPNPPVTIVGFLQVFIQPPFFNDGTVNVIVMNIAGCGNAATNAPVNGTSPVPVRLITSP